MHGTGRTLTLTKSYWSYMIVWCVIVNDCDDNDNDYDDNHHRRRSASCSLSRSSTSSWTTTRLTTWTRTRLKAQISMLGSFIQRFFSDVHLIPNDISIYSCTFSRTVSILRMVSRQLNYVWYWYYSFFLWNNKVYNHIRPKHEQFIPKKTCLGPNLCCDPEACKVEVLTSTRMLL